MEQDITYIPDEIYDSSEKPYDPTLDTNISKDDKVSVDYVVAKLFKGVAVVFVLIFLTALLLYSFPSYPSHSNLPTGMEPHINEIINTPNIETHPVYITLVNDYVQNKKSNNISQEPFDVYLINDMLYATFNHRSDDNSTLNSTLNVCLTILVPSNIIVYAGDEGMDTGEGIYQIYYTLRPGMSTNIPIHVKADENGTYPIDGELEYWYGSDHPVNNTIIMYANFSNTFRVTSP
jgi:hypothetical protein